MHDLLTDTPEAYARRICYISDASTIRARTMDEFGRAPSLEWIRAEQAERRRPMRDYGEAIGMDEPPEVPKSEPAPIVIPEETPASKARKRVAQVAAKMNVLYDDIIGPSRNGLIVRARCLAIAVLHDDYARSISRKDVSIPGSVARIVNRERTTVISALARFWELAKNDDDLARAYRELTTPQ